jgi:hypothetical protein
VCGVRVNGPVEVLEELGSVDVEKRLVCSGAVEDKVDAEGKADCTYVVENKVRSKVDWTGAVEDKVDTEGKVVSTPTMEEKIDTKAMVVWTGDVEAAVRAKGMGCVELSTVAKKAVSMLNASATGMFAYGFAKLATHVSVWMVFGVQDSYCTLQHQPSTVRKLENDTTGLYRLTIPFICTENLAIAGDVVTSGTCLSEIPTVP